MSNRACKSSCVDDRNYSIDEFMMEILGSTANKLYVESEKGVRNFVIKNSNEYGNDVFAFGLKNGKSQISVLPVRWDEPEVIANLFSTEIDNVGIDSITVSEDNNNYLVLYHSIYRSSYPRVLLAKYITEENGDMIMVSVGEDDLKLVPYVRKKYFMQDIAPTISIKAKENRSWSKEEAELLTQLGYACEKGTFVEQDYKAALQFYQLAGKAGDDQGLSNLAWMYQNGLGTEKDVRNAIEIYEKAAAAGNTTAMINLGNIYEYGELGEPDYKKCFKWYKKAAEFGDSKGLFNYANCYHWGYGTRKSYKKAFPIFKQLADEGYEDACFYVGLYYQDGLGIAKDYEQARRYYRRGALADDAYCFNQLGTMYAKGQGVKKDVNAALDYYQEAAGLGDWLAYTNIGWFYENGDIGEADIEMAKKYYKTAAEQGEENAQEALKRLDADEEHNAS
ncbi:MAG: sel1 repeat family protein [Clostridiales bacterium]|nr:sel1 repeat family protein [Clostridiales bacterium]